jgi:flagellar hook-associated protein 2
MVFGSGIGIGGLASGIDTNSIIQKLVQLESIPITQLQDKKTTQKNKLNGVSQLQGLVKDLKAKAKAVSTQSDFLVFDVNASHDGVASFSATGSAEAAAHTLTVNQLASIDRWAFDGVSSSTTNLATAAGETIDFTADGTAYSVAIDQASSSLENIASDINTTAGADVAATVVNTGTAAAPSWKLVLTSKHSGADGRVTGITSSVDGLTIDSTAANPDGTPASTNNITVGLDAIAVVDGLTVQRSTNEFTDVITGLTFTVQAADPSTQITFSAVANKSAIKTKVQALVDSYNAIINFVNTQNTYNKDAGPGGVLFGDSILSSVRSSIHSALFDVPIDDVINDTEGYATLSVVGISTQSDGTLQVDQTKLDDKLAGNLSAFADLFVDSDGFDNGGAAQNTPEYYVDTTADSGLAASLVRAIDRMISLSTGSNGTVIRGLFDSRTQTINDQVKDIDDEILKKQAYVDKFESDLITKFSRLEALVGQLNSSGAGFAAAIAGLPH